MGSSYCTRSDVLAILSQDSEARLTTDPTRAVILPLKGDGLATIFDSPFYGATTITATVAGVATAITLLPNAGAQGVDQIQFATAPVSGAVIAVKGDQKAIDTSIVDRAIADASDEIDSYARPAMSLAGLGWPIADAGVLAMIRPKVVFLVKWRLRRRRDQQEWDPMMAEYRQAYVWLAALMKGDIGFPVGQIESPSTTDNPTGASFGEENETLFSPPYSGLAGRDF